MTDHTHDIEGAGETEVERYELSERARYRFELERRDFMRVLGGGLVVVSALPSLFAQESGRGGQGRGEPQDLAAWLHVDEQGHVTGYTGKTEIGQNVRTSLAQAIADELRVPLSSVSLVMADTDLVPYDAGTFGSQSTPRMGRQLSRAAATAREMLIDQAAARLQVDRATLTAKAGRVIAPGGRSLSYGNLTKGQKLTGTVAAEPAVTPADRWTVRGVAQKKVDGRACVTGRHQYTPDLTRPGMLHGRVIRPDSYGATLVSVDDRRARAMAGITVVRDGDFLAVIAPNERVARRAALAVQAQWTPASGQPSSETVYEHLKKGTSGGRAPSPFVAGDVSAVTGARTFEASYRIPYIAHVPLEPRAAVAEWTDGKLTVWTGTQRPFGVRTELADAFHTPESSVRVIVPDTGSAYGGKHTGDAAIEAARLAKAAGRPVKLVWTRAEEFTWGYLRPAGVIDIKAVTDVRGRIVAWEFDNWNSGNAAIRTPYDVPNQRVTFHPSDSPLRQGSYRGLAATANHYAREMHMDEIARALKIDAVEFRLAHASDERLRAVSEGRRGAIRMAEAFRARPRARHLVRHREGQLRRDSRRAVESGRRVQGRAHRSGVRVRRDRQSGRPAQPGGRVGHPGAGRRPLRGNRVQQRTAPERDPGAIPRATIQGRSRDRHDPAGSKGPRLRGGGRDADCLRRAGNRLGRARVRHRRDGAARQARLSGAADLLR